MTDPSRGLHRSTPGSTTEVARVTDGAFRALFETSGEALLIVSSEGVLEDANARARTLLGMDSGTAGHHKMTQLFTASNIIRLASLTQPVTGTQRLEVSLESGMPLRLTLRAILPGSLDLLLFVEGHAPGTRAGDEEWHQLESELRCVLNAVQAGIALFDYEGGLRSFNSRFCELFDVDQRRFETMKTFDELNASVANRFRSPETFSARWKAFKAGNLDPFPEEVEIDLPNTRVLERLSRPVLDAQGRAAGWLEIYSDVTAYRQIQSKMLQTEKMAALGQVVSGIAHELNNPLTTIMGYAQLLLGHGLASSQLDQARNVYQEAERARRIVKNLLYFARENKPERTVVDLNEIVERTVALRSYELKVEGIAVGCDLAADLPKTTADPHQLQQAVLNLLMNAEQALQERSGGGQVIIRTRLVQQQTGNRLSLEIGDNGPGIAPEITARIFDPFFTTKAPGAGTGLGLSIVYGIVRQHDGDVTVENQSEGGAKFTVELPIVALVASGQDLRQRPAATLSRVSPGRILVVEDEPTVARLITDILQEEGHHAEAVLNSHEGLALVSRNAYDLVLCDVRMPGLDGRAFYEELVRACSPMQRKILFITGDTLAPATVEFLDPKGLPYLAKPFLVEELKLAVNQQLQANRKNLMEGLESMADGAHAGE